MDRWANIPGFPSYLVRDDGSVYNENSGRFVKAHINQQGNLFVRLYSDGIGRSRSLALLVAEAFLDPPQDERWNTPIHLNGDKSDCSSDNLAWRDRGMAKDYHRMMDGNYTSPHLKHPLSVRQTGEIFPNSFEVARKYGLMEGDVVVTALNNHQGYDDSTEYIHLQFDILE